MDWWTDGQTENTDFWCVGPFGTSPKYLWFSLHFYWNPFVFRIVNWSGLLRPRSIYLVVLIYTRSTKLHSMGENFDILYLVNLEGGTTGLSTSYTSYKLCLPSLMMDLFSKIPLLLVWLILVVTGLRDFLSNWELKDLY